MWLDDDIHLCWKGLSVQVWAPLAVYLFPQRGILESSIIGCEPPNMLILSIGHFVHEARVLSTPFI